MNKNAEYTLAELAVHDLDSWTQAIFALHDDATTRQEAYRAAGVPSGLEREAPELVSQYEYIAARDKFRFDALGNVVSFDRS